MTEEQSIKASALAEKIIQLSRNALVLNLRFMDSAVFRLIPVASDTTLATDGRFIYYGISHILRRYKNEPQQVTRDILHIVLHCVFRHSFVKPPIDTQVWDLAADIAVENAINSIDINCVDVKRVVNQRKTLSELHNNLKSLNAEQIYRYFKDKDFSLEQLSKVRDNFISDDHSCWYDYSRQQEMRSQRDNDNDNSESQNQNHNNSQKSSGGLGENNKEDSYLKDVKSDLEKEWEDVSKKIQIDMETFSKQQGDTAGSMVQQLRELNREKYDYGIFLKKFAVMGEAMQINDDEFDYIFYTYGLQLFGNVPLIEPLEYKEVRRVRDFVVAIDTSGSTSGSLVQKFLEKTYNILKSTESFFSKINLHIIQCDAAIQEHVKITNQEELENYIRSLTIKGLGGTDFRPVFTLVDKLIESGEFSRLKGMIYFTDGFGIFPANKPSYETAFVFIQDSYYNPEVPPWAIKLILNNEDI